MELSSGIILRSRFKFDVDKIYEQLLKGFEGSKDAQSDFMVTRIDDHVFIKFSKQAQPFWYPQLHLEINKKDEYSTTAHVHFGPNTSV
jgi:hypothetical protein